jgi:alkylation response protein AidB-like acyl-CoA dehydrogenase
MNFEFNPLSPQGVQLAELADKHAADVFVTAGEYDRANTFPYPHWESLRRSGLLAASVPVDLGGRGVTSALDLAVAVSRLARGDGAIAIGVAMHLSTFWYLARLSDRESSGSSAASGNARFAGLLRLLLRRCGRGRVVACVAISEAGTSLGRPHTTAERVGDGYRVNGRKTFCTASPVGTLFCGTVRIASADGPDRLGFAVLPRDTAGLTVQSNWDALGMRASGSNDVLFEDCEVPAHMVTEVGPVGVLGADLLPMTMVGVLTLAAAALGIAERSQELAVGSVSPGATPRAAVRDLIAENEIDLATSRAVLTRVASTLDTMLSAPTITSPPPVLSELMMQVQCANVAVKRAAVAIVDRCLTVCGGRGYLSSSPLSRLYRDVRAGPFMQPFSALDAPAFIGDVRLGVGPY